MFRLTVTLELPPQNVRPNSRPHWRAKAKAVQDYRAKALAAAQEALGGKYPPYLEAALVHIKFYNKTARKMDGDNIIASMKSAIDGLTDAGIFDDDREVMYLPPLREKDKDNPRIELLIFECDDEDPVVKSLNNMLKTLGDEEFHGRL